MLAIVATPIGNLGDITLRAIETLKACDVVAAEDTRRTRALLTHLGIAGKELVSLHAHTGDKTISRLVSRLERGSSVALVTDAGTPSVSDPGEALVRAAIQAGIRVVPIPGASAVLAALSASGLSEHGFRFFGFLPRGGAERAEAIARVQKTEEPVVIFESPERAQKTLSELAREMPARRACVCRELTKIHEELARGTLEDLAQPREWIGEITIVLGAFESKEHVTDAEIDARIDEEVARGAHAKSISQRVAAWAARPQREIYARILERKR